MKNKHQIPLDYEVLIPAPFGAVGIIAQGLQVTVELIPEAKTSKKSANNKLAMQVASQIEAYLEKADDSFNIPLKLKGTPFQRKVWQEISAIPRGQVLTYSDIAAHLKSSPRAVANACGANHLPLVIPCHRVVAKDGIGGFMKGAENGLNIKKWLLHHEGASYQNGQPVA
ncbi:MAG TPA: methylated-DNA--[protein]-cysteine S-methyltransferase [Methylotenera sp.]|nr:methylated-DNA--[protein]-cysteine S-methyltransferase [Methylotenera sp.]HPH05391.1 methylated-DNA--[protein]-cysteine S-methyltransferase [Methylotenera sp.]HPN01317.1 methylated-DNA--[protein]-cysteine S-methyltransferase [Methylotenera sp.]